MDDDGDTRAQIGGNYPPLDQPEDLAKRLEREQADLVMEAARLESESFSLPAKCDTEEEAQRVADFVLKDRAFAKKAEGVRVDTKAPYLASVRIVDGFFGDLTVPSDARVKELSARINAYQRAKAEREAAERRERERVERERAEAARREAERLEREARQAEQDAERERQRIRAAPVAEERAAAEASMRDADQRAAEARAASAEVTKEVAQAERSAEAHGKAATNVAGLGRVSAGGSTAGVSKFWNHRIKDADALCASLGPLGPYFSNDAIISAIGEAKRQHAGAGTIAGLAIPGVEFFEDTRTSVRAARR